MSRFVFLRAAVLFSMPLLAGACASSGAVPHPFPLPGSARTAPGGEPSAPPEDSGATNPSSLASPLDPSRPLILPSPSRPLWVLTAMSLRGTPYRTGGSDPGGFDCSGFTQYVFAQYGIALAREVRDQFLQGKSVQADAIAPGDLLFFSTTGPGPSHVAIAIGGDEFVHTPSSTGVVRVEHLSVRYWSARYLGARRVD
jgi:cell wall-associated NlpC family hydrolase